VGAVYVFTRASNWIHLLTVDWTEQAFLRASNLASGDGFGMQVALSGDSLAVAAQAEDSDGTSEGDNSATNAGAAYLFSRNGSGVWSQLEYVKASNPEAYDDFGFSIDLSGDTLAVGAFWEDSNAVGIDGDQSNNDAGDSGAVYVFK
ncbi:MAG: FG-GAP repeat protein, partial [Candidatus Thiodiazotropha sp. (ex Notomyrtea botanica)]|nr:FG-GAP repeat protein [Candidatus Thiodiazotropha sp. (ex Notomyrtea botanica)]